MLTLHGVYRSRATRPLWMLHEIGMDFTHVPVIQGYRLPDPPAPDAPLNTTSPAFLAINPQGGIPAMEDDGLVLTESLAITLHIARKYGGALGPQDLNEAALAEQWALMAATSIEPPAIEIMYTYREGQQTAADGAARIAAAMTSLTRPLNRLDAHLATQDWLMGDRFTVADIVVAECLRYVQGHKPVLAAHPVTAEWLARCQSRRAFQQMMAARDADPA